jgi:hypothetical protein
MLLAVRGNMQRVCACVFWTSKRLRKATRVRSLHVKCACAGVREQHHVPVEFTPKTGSAPALLHTRALLAGCPQHQGCCTTNKLITPLTRKRRACGRRGRNIISKRPSSHWTSTAIIHRD